MKPRVAPSCWLRFDLPIPTGFMQSKLTVIDFFDGAGGLSFGFARADFAVEVAVDKCAVASHDHALRPKAGGDLSGRSRKNRHLTLSLAG